MSRRGFPFSRFLLNVLPKTSDLSSIVQSIAEESPVKEAPERLPNETASEYDARTLGVK